MHAMHPNDDTQLTGWFVTVVAHRRLHACFSTTMPPVNRVVRRYKQLLFYANKIAALPAEDHVPANKVEGCVSQVPLLSSAADLAAPGVLHRPFLLHP